MTAVILPFPVLASERAERLKKVRAEAEGELRVEWTPELVTVLSAQCEKQEKPEPA